MNERERRLRPQKIDPCKCSGGGCDPAAFEMCKRSGVIALSAISKNRYGAQKLCGVVRKARDAHAD
jgi:hypothetical protein